MTDWKKFADDSTFTVEVEGATFRCAKPSAAQLTARGVLPPALTLSVLDPKAARMNGDRNRLLLDEKAQDALLDAVLIEPEIWDGPFADCPENQVPRRALARVRDVLVVAILANLYDVDLVRGAAFRGGQGDGGDVRPNRQARRALDHGRDAPARGRAGLRGGADRGGVPGT